MQDLTKPPKPPAPGQQQPGQQQYQQPGQQQYQQPYQQPGQQQYQQPNQQYQYQQPNQQQYQYQQSGQYQQAGYQSFEQTELLAQEQERVFFQKIYFWMCGALVVTGLTGYFLSKSYAWFHFLTYSKITIFLILGVQIGLVIAINALMNKVSSAVIKVLFGAFAISMGFTTSIVLLAYPSGAIAKAFFTTAIVYAAMAIFGLVTKKSLKAWGAFLFMGLIGLIAASVINLFLHSPAMDYVICWVGVIVFAGLTAYDHQKLRVLFASNFQDSYNYPAGSETIYTEQQANLVTYGALTLYLDFINLFLFLVRLFGRE
ncbi:MAG: Bax inhibitor-1/YccA family protein [Deltaproteobacteria bacterium]|jgi:FtsH-binding integral membrane protein|nr:Bax inhibitor-1/YccA family protein [Deltaproteobacteria bacterium]